MPKALCYVGMAVAVVVLILFGLDLIIGWPFYGYSIMVDASFVISAGLLGFLAWSTLRELER